MIFSMNRVKSDKSDKNYLNFKFRFSDGSYFESAKVYKNVDCVMFKR